LGPPSKSTLCRSVLPRVSTERFCMTIASASEHMISSDGIPVLTRFTMSVSAKTPHLAATWWRWASSKWSLRVSSDGMPTLIMHLSIVAPVPEAHLSFIEAMAVLSPVFWFSLKTMILASWPPSSTTEPASGCNVSTAKVTEFTSCTNFAPSGPSSGFAPEPVMNTRTSFDPRSARMASMRTMKSSTHSACLVWCRW